MKQYQALGKTIELSQEDIQFMQNYDNSKQELREKLEDQLKTA